ncbi:hypothetical protein BDN67DRAFT_218233 [Paxillus ammoniavirescens]|nr:hypothetical protein BDN67DRAFT_218233 [Paxillus ammoniavirescens]
MLAPDNYDRGPVLPRLRLPDQAGEANLPRRESTDNEGRGSPEATISPRLRGKKKRTGTARETGEGIAEEKRTKVARKIYVACDFCRGKHGDIRTGMEFISTCLGRKLRCDGSKPCCSNCATRSLACRYQDHPRRRGPGKAPKGSRSRKTETKGRKGNKAAKQAESETQSDMANSSAHFEPSLALTEDDRSRPYGELQATYGSQPYTDRPSGSNAPHESYVLDSTPFYHFTGEAFNRSAEHFGPPQLSRMQGERDEDKSTTELTAIWTQSRGDTDEEEGFG